MRTRHGLSDAAKRISNWVSAAVHLDPLTCVQQPLRIVTSAARRCQEKACQVIADIREQWARTRLLPRAFDQLEQRMMFSTVVAAGTYFIAPNQVNEGEKFSLLVDNQSPEPLQSVQVTFGDGTTEIYDGSVTQIDHSYQDGWAVFPVTMKAAHGTEGLSHGYWKQPHHLDDWAGYQPSDSFEAVFGVDVPASAKAGDNPTLLQALQAGGGGVNALMREAVAGLLNASHPNIDYKFLPAQVILKVQGAFLLGQYDWVKNDLESQNKGQADLSSTNSPTATLWIAVDNLPPELAPIPGQSADEGVEVSLDLGSFNDPGVIDYPWTVTFDPGDGSVASSFTVMSQGDLPNVAYTYADNGQYTASIVLADKDGGTASGSFGVVVSNVAPVLTVAADQTSDEGAWTSFALGSISDLGANDAPWTISVDTGDGSPAISFPVDKLGELPPLQHRYLDDGQYTVTVTVTDKDLASTSGSFAVNVANLPPQVTSLTVEDGVEGQEVLLSVAYADPGLLDGHSGLALWDDGAATPLTIDPVTRTASASHIFLDDGVYYPSVVITDNGGASAMATTQVMIANAPPVITDLHIADGAEGDLLVLTGSFADPGPLDSHVAWAAWGDGTTSLLTVDPVTRTFSGGHTFIDDGAYTPVVTLVDNGGASAEATVQVLVANAQPVLVAPADQQATEGSVISVDLGSFTDAGVNDAPWSVAINPGDGSPAIEFTVVEQGQLPTLDHVFLDDGTYQVTVQLTDKDGATAEQSFNVVVANAAPVITALEVAAGVEGLATSLTAAYSDLGVLDTHLAGILWGDGSESVGLIDPVSRTITAEHVYVQDGNYTVTLTLTDNGGASATLDTVAYVANAAPVLTPAVDQTAVEGTAVSLLLGSFGDLGTQDGPWTVAVDPGDGSSVVEFTVAQQGELPSFDYTYLDNGDFLVRVSVMDGDGATASGSFAVAVANAAPILFLPNDQAATEGSGATIELGSFGDLGSQDGPWTVAVDPGDGSSSLEFTVDEQGNLPNLSHTFADNGIYPVIVTITDNGGASTSGSFNVVVANVPPALTISGDDEGIVGQAYTLNLSSVDPGADTIEYWAINWDLLNTAPGSEPEVIPGDPSSVQHTYAQAGTYTIRATATDEDGSFDSNSISVEMTVVVVGTLLVENSDFTVSHEQLFTVPENPGGVSFQFTGLSFDQTSGGGGGGDSIKDAFEIALVDPTTGLPLVGTITAGRDAFFNLTESQLPGLGGGARYDANTNTVMLDITGLAPGSQAKLIYRLVNNDDDTTTAVTILPDLDLSGSAISGATTATPSTVRALPGAVDFTLLSDVTASVDVDYTRTSWNQQRDILYANLTLTNAGGYEVRNSGGGRLLVGVANISSPQVVAYQPDGLTPGGMPYFDISHLAFSETDGTLAPGESVSGIELRFANPTGVQFSYDLVVLGHVNEAPAFTSTPVIEVPVGKPYSYAAQASDTDGDAPSFTLLSGPAGMIVDAQTGQVSWNTTGDDLGNHSILLEVADGRGGVAQQSYTLSVVNVPNRPPIFSSSPVVDANVASQYTYSAVATDPDQDDLTFAVLQGPAGFTIDPDTGSTFWTPTVDQLGQQSITLSVSDSSGAAATQQYTVLVQQAVGNHAPVIVSDPVVNFVLPNLPNPTSGLVDPATISLNLAPNQQQSLPVTITVPDLGGTDLEFPPSDIGIFHVGDVFEGQMLIGTFQYTSDERILRALNIGGPFSPIVPINYGFDAAGNVYVMNSSYPSFQIAVSKYDPNGQMVAAFPLPSPGGFLPVSYTRLGNVAMFNGVDRFYVSFGSTITEYDVSGTVLRTFPTAPGYAPLAVSPDNATLYYAYSGQLRAIDLATGNDSALVSDASISSPTSLAALTNGDLLVGDVSDIKRIDPATGEFLDIYSTSPMGVWNILAPIPGTNTFLAHETVTDHRIYTIDADTGLINRWGDAAFSGATALGVFPGVASTAATHPPINDPPQAGTISGQLYFDANQDGVKDPAEYVLPGWTVFLDSNQNGAIDDGETTTTSDSSGNYLFTGLPAGTYTIAQQPQPGWTLTSPGDSYSWMAISPFRDPRYANWEWDPAYDPNSGFGVPVEGAAASLIDGKLYVSHGNRAGPDVPYLSIYDTTTDTWIHGGAAAPNDSGDVWLHAEMGGGTAYGRHYGIGGRGLFRVAEFDPVSLQWTTVASLNIGRGQFGAASWENKVYAVGGDIYESKTIEVYDPLDNTWTMLSEMPLPWFRTEATVAYDGKIYVFGGLDAENYETVNDVQIYDIATNTWRMGAPMPTPRLAAGAGVLNDKIVVYGGASSLSFWEGDKNLTVTEVYDPLTNTWSPGPDMIYPAAELSQGVTFDDSGVYAIGSGFGQDTPGAQKLHLLSGVHVVTLTESNGTANLDFGNTSASSTIDVNIVASDANAPFVNQTGVVVGVQSGQEVTFDAQFTGDGQAHSFDLLFTNAATNAVLGSIPVAINLSYSDQVQAVDPDGDAVVYRLLASPDGASIDPATGTIRWVPPAAGDYQFTLRAEDGRGGSDDQSFTLSVSVTNAGNQNPTITSTAPANAHVDRVFGYQMSANDPDGDGLSYFLDSAPAGMSVDSRTGRLKWTPTADQQGEALATVRVFDGRGGSAFQTFTVNVGPRTFQNRLPEITSTPETSILVGETFRYQLSALDVDADQLTLNLLVGPDGLGLDPISGQVVWEPATDQLGEHPVLFSVSDGQGGVDIQAVSIVVRQPNRSPVISSIPVTSAFTGVAYQYRVRAQDLDGDTLTFGLTIAPEGMQIDALSGVISWTPAVDGVTEQVAVVAEDGFGGIATQDYVVTALIPGSNRAPQLTAQPRSSIGIGSQWFFIPAASDPDGDNLTFSLVAGPTGMAFDPNENLARWQPTADQLGANDLTISVTDGRGGVDQRTFTVYVTHENQNQAPVIISQPRTAAVSGFNYRYEVSGTDPDFDPVVFTLGEHPDGMAIDALTGVVTWTPTPQQVGDHAASVVVMDGFGSTDTQSYVLTVRGVNSPPVIESAPAVQAALNKPYLYSVRADDADQDALSFALLEAPAGMGIDPEIGLITWLPDSGQLSTHVIILAVNDGNGGSATQQYTLQVRDALNLDPVITSRPSLVAVLNDLYQYQIVAEDEDAILGDSLLYQLVTGDPAMSLDPNTGLLSWTPTATGVQAVSVAVVDSQGGAAFQSYDLTTRTNASPYWDSTSPPQVTAGKLYRYDVRVIEPDSDPLTYELLPGAPEGMTIDVRGRIRWQTGLANVPGNQPTIYQVGVRATDPFGAAADQVFDLTVSPDVTAPAVTLMVSALAKNTMGVALVVASDNVGIISRTLTFNGEPVALDRTGAGEFTPTEAGYAVLVVTASDAVGNTTSTSMSVFVIDPFDIDAPEVSITSPTDEAPVTAPIDVVGTVYDQELFDYTLSYAAVDGESLDASSFVEFASGSTSVVNGVLGRFDPTLLANGSYIIRLTAFDFGGHRATVDQIVTVAGNLKLGNFNLSFTDLSLPLGGIPITISRTYDTLNANRMGDFGYGWDLDIVDVRLTTDLAGSETTGMEDLGVLPAFRDGTRVYVTLPDGSRQGFTFVPKPLDPPAGSGAGGQFGAALLANVLGLFQPAFIPDRGVTSTLTVGTGLQILRQDDGTYIIPGGNIPFNPASNLLSATYSTYTLTLKDGVQYQVDGKTGHMLPIRDRNGNSMEIRDDGIFTRTPAGTLIAQVPFERDQLGRITTITDPEGNSIRYAYDANGDLVSVTDGMDANTTLQYAIVDNPHVLSKIVNALGQEAMTLQYDSNSGRITSLGVPGAAIPFSYRLDLGDGRFAEQVADANNVPTILVRDTRGNLIRRIQRLTDNVDPAQRKFLVTVWQFDANDNTTHESDTFQVTDESTIYDVQPPYWRSIKTFDAAGNLTSETNALGQTSYFTFDSLGNLLTSTRFDGNTRSNQYDDRGNLVRTVDAAGIATTYEYDGNGNQTAVRNSLGVILSSSMYDASGRLTSSTPAAGLTTFNAYDSNGNQTRSWQVVTTDEGTFQIIDQTTYNAQGNVTGTARIVNDGSGERTLSSNSTQFNDLGQQVQTINELGLSARNVYDYRGQLIETRQESRNPDGSTAWLLARTVYDDNGQTIFSTDTFLEGQTPSRGYVTLTDAQGRSVGSQVYRDPVVELVEEADGLHAVLTSSGTLISSTSRVLDERGRLAASTDRFGSETRYLYDLAGRNVQTRRQSRDETGQVVWIVNEQVYDALGRVFVSTDQHVEGQPTTSTHAVYDSLGRQVRNEHLWGVVVQVTVDSETGLASSSLTDPGQVVAATESRYNSLGQLAETTDSRGGITTYEYDDLRRNVATIGPAVNVVGYADPIRERTETIYDEQGRGSQSLSRIVVLADGTQDRNQLIVTNMVYDEFGRVVQINLPDGTNTRTELDDLGRKVAEIDQAGRIKRYEYAAASEPGAGNLSAMILPELFETAAHGSANSTGSPRYEYEYDARGNLVVARDALGRATTFTYDNQNRQLSRTLPLGQIESIEYDDFGRESLHTSYEGVITRFLYDDRPGSSGRLTSKEFYLNRQAYDDFLASLPGAGPDEVWTYSYTALGQVAEVVQDRDGDLATTDDARPEIRGYDLGGRLSVIATPEGIINYTYDLATGDHTGTWTGTDPANPITDIVYGYDTLGRLVLVSNTARFGEFLAQPDNMTYGYDLTGQLAQQVFPNGITSDYTRDVLGRTVELTQTRPDGVLVASYSYILDVDGRRLGVVETELADQDLLTYETRAVRWTYDNEGRLSREEHDFEIADSGTYDWTSDFEVDRRVDYVLDLLGNRLWQLSDFNGDGLTDEQIGYTYDENDRLLAEDGRIVEGVVTKAEYFWGAAGSEIVMGGAPGEATDQTGILRYERNNWEHVLEQTEYIYNLQDQLARAPIQREEDGHQTVTEVTYSYNQEGIRSQSTAITSVDGAAPNTTTTEFLVDPTNPTGYQQTLEETATTQPDGVTETQKTLNISGLAVTAQADSDGNLHILLPDALGSTRQVVDRAARNVQLFLYDAYGVNLRLQAVSNSRITDYQYRNQYRDEPLGQDYLRARWMTAELGLFNQMDPILGLAVSQIAPSYLYTYADPVQGSDPTGRFALIELLIVNFTLGQATQPATQPASHKEKSSSVIALDNFRTIKTFAEGLKHPVPTAIIADLIAANGTEFAYGVTPGYHSWTNNISLPTSYYYKNSYSLNLEPPSQIGSAGLSQIYNEMFHAWYDQVLEEQDDAKWLYKVFRKLAEVEYVDSWGIHDQYDDFQEAFSETIDQAADDIRTGRRLSYETTAQASMHGGDNDTTVISRKAYRVVLWILFHGYKKPAGVTNPDAIDDNLDAIENELGM